MTPKTPVQETRLAPHLALIAVQVMFGTWPIVGKVALRAISSSGLVGLRVVGAAIVFVALRGKLRELPRLPGRDLAMLMLCSMLGVVVNQLLFVKGLSLTTVINATLLSTTIPVFTLIVSIIFGYDRISLRRVIGILLAGSGVFYLVDPWRAQFSPATTGGNLLIVINSFCYGAYIAVSKDLFKRYGALNVITWMFAIGCLVSAPIGGYALSNDRLSTASIWIWVAVIYIILIPTVAAYYLNAWALTRVAPTTVATYIYLQPLIAFGLAPLLLGEKLSSRTLIACILIFTGVGVVSRQARSRAAKDVIEHPDAMAH
ncbi:MAG TPA: DMT family transporter [Pyrinomonadaceae bacterium]|nr:DMT family transporter [Pyrinomonadaceae bacterium]